jgi:hypothetical protein
MKSLTREQRVALLSIYHRDWGHYKKPSYMDFRRGLIRPYGNNPCAMIKWHGIWVSIEADGYAHME